MILELLELVLELGDLALAVLLLEVSQLAEALLQTLRQVGVLATRQIYGLAGLGELRAHLTQCPAVTLVQIGELVLEPLCHGLEPLTMLALDSDVVRKLVRLPADGLDLRREMITLHANLADSLAVGDGLDAERGNLVHQRHLMGTDRVEGTRVLRHALRMQIDDSV